MLINTSKRTLFESNLFIELSKENVLYNDCFIVVYCSVCVQYLVFPRFTSTYKHVSYFACKACIIIIAMSCKLAEYNSYLHNILKYHFLKRLNVHY